MIGSDMLPMYVLLRCYKGTKAPAGAGQTDIAPGVHCLTLHGQLSL